MKVFNIFFALIAILFAAILFSCSGNKQPIVNNKEERPNGTNQYASFVINSESIEKILEENEEIIGLGFRYEDSSKKMSIMKLTQGMGEIYDFKPDISLDNVGNDSLDFLTHLEFVEFRGGSGGSSFQFAYLTKDQLKTLILRKYIKISGALVNFGTTPSVKSEHFSYLFDGTNNKETTGTDEIEANSFPSSIGPRLLLSVGQTLPSLHVGFPCPPDWNNLD